MPIAGSVKHCCWLAQEGRGRRSATFWILIKLYTHLACLSRENIRAIKGLVWKSSAGWSFLHAYATTIMKFERCASQHAFAFFACFVQQLSENLCSYHEKEHFVESLVFDGL